MASIPPAFSQCFPSPKTQEDNDRDEEIYKSYDNLTSQLPILHHWPPFSLIHYQSCWIPNVLLPITVAIQSYFNPRPADILLVTNPKSGTTWLKALAFATLHRHTYSLSNHPLLTTTPHDCVPFLETLFNHRTIPHLNILPSPTIFTTHLPLSLLPKSVLSCRIVYLCRDPKDTFVSLWSFTERMSISLSGATNRNEGFEFNKAFQLFSQGIAPFGPFWDHELGYWNGSLRRPEKVLFLRYEKMMEDPVNHLRRLAEFMGCPFSTEEERDGVMEDLVGLCSFDKLSNLEVNKGAVNIDGETSKAPVAPDYYFRKGKVGDWVNYLSIEMAEKLDAITKEKLHGSGLSFETSTAASICASSQV
ncbi:P-loop containing nucleoside triphosphate hydrolase protein [Dioscorea alata]|uniref:P-loop containing nucleoside triphosphate hydrolase protein n=1 Tax=Dioscorea alata TaxID=55571 RepID=A0ACB7V0N5_DIOAL|nr:P-loop containing nucleoside triphosphate hydrolase protein [Dioscorea alata]